MFLPTYIIHSVSLSNLGVFITGVNAVLTVLIIAINCMMKCTKDIDKNSNLGFPRLVKDHQKFLKLADKHQRYINSTLFLLNSHEIIEK